MSQFSSPWGDRARVSALKENLQKPLEYIPTLPEPKFQGNTNPFSYKESKYRTTQPHNIKNNFGIQLQGNRSSAINSSIKNAKNDPKFREWLKENKIMCDELYSILINELKKMSLISKESLQLKFDLQNFYKFIYGQESTYKLLGRGIRR